MYFASAQYFFVCKFFMQVGPKVKFGLAKSRVVRDETRVTANYKIRPRLYFASTVFLIVLYFARHIFCIVMYIIS